MPSLKNNWNTGDLYTAVDQNAVAAAVNGLTGVVLPFAGTAATVPTGWLLCYGQAVSRATYSALFAVIGTTYGAGDGSTTFGIPDLRGRAVAGVDNMGGTAAGRLTGASGSVAGTTLGASGGEETHNLSQNEMPSHTHVQNSHNHSQNPHNHNLSVVGGAVGGLYLAQNTVGGGGLYTDNATASNNATTGTNQNTGGSANHNNVQPAMVLNYIICA
jgi:microcystin-dependent protein